MKSKTSFFNATLYRKNLTRFWPLWGLASFVAALFPLSMIMLQLRGDMDMATKAEFANLYYSGMTVVPSFMLMYALPCAAAVWSYLYNARSVGMMHTLPIRREGLFVTNFLSGMTMLAIPWCVIAVLMAILSLMCGAFDAGTLCVTALCVAGEGFFFFASATAAAFITGHILAFPLLYFHFHFLAPMLDMLITTFSANTLFGLASRDYTGVVEWLSPTLYLTTHTHVERLYKQVPVVGEPNVTESVLDSVSLQGAWLVGVYVLVGIALLGVAYLLYRRRQSECAGEVIAMPWGRPVFRYGISALAALGGGQLLYVFFYMGDFWGQGETYRVLPMSICMVIVGAIGYYAATMMLEKTLRVFNKGSLRGLSFVAAGCVIFCCAIGFDVFGVTKRVPSVGSLRYVQLSTANNTYYLFPGEDDDVIEQLRGVHRAIIDDKDYVLQRQRDGGNMQAEDFGTYGWATFNVNYYLKGGLSVAREYALFLDKDRMSEPGTYDNLLDTFINSTEMKLRRLRANDARFVPRSGSLSITVRDGYYDFSSRELQQALNAVAQDAAENTWGQFEWFADDGEAYAVRMDFVFSVDIGEGLREGSIDHLTVRLRPGMRHTIQALTDMGYLKDGDLATLAEMNAIWEEQARKDMEYTEDSAPVISSYGT